MKHVTFQLFSSNLSRTFSSFSCSFSNLRWKFSCFRASFLISSISICFSISSMDRKLGDSVSTDSSRMCFSLPLVLQLKYSPSKISSKLSINWRFWGTVWISCSTLASLDNWARRLTSTLCKVWTEVKTWWRTLSRIASLLDSIWIKMPLLNSNLMFL